jgi:hypothetical protein
MSMAGSACNKPKRRSLLRRLVVMATALAVLVGAVSAYAATSGLNTYTATLKFSPNAAGSSKAPSAIAFTEKYTASGTNGNRTAPLTDIKTTIYGAVANWKSFPTCSESKIAAAHSDAVCPKGAKIASGGITAILGPESNTSTSAPGTAPCDPVLDAWNGGGGKVVFFFVDPTPTTCAGLTTGAVPPYVGSAKTVGKNLVLDTPVPAYVSFPLTGVEGSLTSLTLHYVKLTTKVKGKTVAYSASTSCKGGKRPYSVTFTAESAPGAAPQSGTVTGTQKCMK